MADKTKIKLKFIVFGDNFDPETLDMLVGLSNTLWHRKDDIIPNRPNLGRKETSWTYSIDGFDTLILSDLTDFFVKTIDEKIRLLLEFIDHHNLESKFYVVFEVVNSETPALFFNKGFIEVANKLNAEIDIDFYIG